MLFLAKCEVQKSEYMSEDNIPNYFTYHLVEAADEREAQKKAEAYYRKKTSEYSVYYSAYVEILETIT